MDYEAQIEQAKQRAQRFAQQSDFQAPQGQMVGGRFVAPNVLQYLASGLRSVGGMAGEQMAKQEVQDLTANRQKAIADALRQFGEASQGTPANVPGDGMGPVMPAQAPDMMGAYQRLLEAPDAGLRNMAVQGMARIPELQAQREAKMEERRMMAEQRVAELQMQHEQRMAMLAEQNASRERMAQEQREFQRQMQAERLQSAREMRELTGAITRQTGAEKPPAGYRFKPDGTLEAIPGGPAAGKDGQKPLTESQGKGTLFLGQMRSATRELEKLPQVSPVSTAMTQSAWTNWAASKEGQKVAQLQNQWAEAYLRAKTGAAATAGEVEGNRRTFFPVVGDSQAVIKQKAEMRRQAERDMEATAGPGAAIAGTPPQATPRPRIRFDAQGNPIK